LGKRDHLFIGILLAGIFLPVFSLFPSLAEGRLLNLGGAVDLSYGVFRTAQTEQVTETTFFQQRYNLHNFGEIIDPRLGTFFINGTFLSQDANSQGDSEDRNFRFNDYSLALNLFPYISPLSFYAQRATRADRLDAVVKDRITTYGANWSLSVPRLPRLSLSYNQSELHAEDANRLPDTLSRFFNAESSGRLGNTTLVGRYQFNQTDVARESGVVERIPSQSMNLNTESRLSSTLSLSTFVREATVGGVNAPGLTFSQERGLGASLFYTPSVHWDTHARVEYSEIPDSTQFNRLLAFWSGSIRPSEQLDMVTSVRYYRFEVANTTTQAPFADFNLSYRPFFGLTTGFGLSLGDTRTEGGGAATSSLYQRYRTYVNYTRSVDILRYTVSDTLSYGTADTSHSGSAAPASEKLKDWMNTLFLGVENTQIRIVHIAIGYTFNDINRGGQTVQPIQDQRSHTLQVNVDSSYFRGLWFPDDSLLLQGSTSLTRIQGFGPEGNTYMHDVQGSYFFWQGAILSAGWTHQDYPSGFYADSDLFFEALQWSFYFGNTNVALGARDGHQRSRESATLKRDTLEVTATFAYQIGKFLFNLDNRWANDRSAGVAYKSQSIFARATRMF
jgi:hypothetical protein